MAETKAESNEFSKMKTAVVLALVFLLFHSSLQDAETPDPNVDVTVELILLRDKFIELSTGLKFMQKYNADLEAKLTAIELQLKKQKATPKIAFSAALANSVGPYDIDFTLVYTNVITNLGQAYNPLSGIFTAPVRGNYYIRYTSCGNTGRHGMALDLYKNNEKMSGLGKESDGYLTYFSGGLVMQLEAGDVVYTKLPPNTKLYEDTNNRTTFSGFLIFPN